MAGSHSTPSHAVIVSPYANEEPMPAGATGTLFLLRPVLALARWLLAMAALATSPPPARQRLAE